MIWVVSGLLLAGAFLAASALAARAHERFLDAAKGCVSHAMERNGLPPTPLDTRIGELTDAHPNASGLRLLAGNLDAFAARALSARKAGRSLDLMYYIWHGDLTGRLLAAEALAAADRGVRVRLLLDDLGVSGDDRVMLALDSHENIELRLFNPTRARANHLHRWLEMLLRAWSVNRRMHNKAWIVDGRLAIVGGRNVGDEYYDASETSNFRDLDLLAVGPAVRQAEAVFDDYWNSGLALPIGKLAKGIRPRLDRLRAAMERSPGSDLARPYTERLRERVSIESLLDPAAIHWCEAAEVVCDPPEKACGRRRDADNDLMRRLMPVMGAAGASLEIVSPYFIPGDKGVEALAALVRKGVAVSVLTNSLAATDVAAVHGGYAPYRPRLLAKGVRLYELMADGRPPRLSLRGSGHASLHTKAFAVDEGRGFIGSLNFDPRSASLNTEMGILFESADLVRLLRAEFQEETRPDVSYALSLDDEGDVVWDFERNGEAVRERREPNATLPRRLFAALVGWLPLESQL